MPLKPISNKDKLSHDLVGQVIYKSGKINIELNPFCQVTLLRDGNTCKLLETGNQKSSITGVPKEKDVYTLGKSESILTGKTDDLLIITFEKVNIFPNLKKLFKIPKQSFVVKDNSINEAVPQGRKTTLTVGVVLMVLLLVSVVFGMKQKKLKEFNSKSEILLTQALNDYNEAVNSLSLDKEKSRELFTSSKEVANKLSEDGYRSESLIKLLEDINSQEGDILGEIKSTLNEFLDLTLQTSEFNGDELSSSGEDIFIIDKNNKNIIKVGIINKSAEIFAGSSDVNDTLEIGSYEERLFLLKGDGIYEVKNKATKILEKDWEDSKMYLYAGNIYLIDKVNNSIFRYPGIQNGFGEKSDWMAPGIDADFSKVKDVTIDGAIWLLSSSGKVSKFILGSPQQILLKGLIGQLDNPTAIYTNENCKYVYILEKDKGRIVAIEKNGEFKVQYVSDDIKNAKDLVVNEEEGKIVLLIGPKLMYIKI